MKSICSEQLPGPEAALPSKDVDKAVENRWKNCGKTGEMVSGFSDCGLATMNAFFFEDLVIFPSKKLWNDVNGYPFPDKAWNIRSR